MKKVFVFLICGLVVNLVWSQIPESECSLARIKYANIAEEVQGVPEENLYDAKFVKLELQLTNLNNSIRGVATMHAKAVESLSQCVLELHDNLVVDSVYFNGIKRTFIHNSGILKILAPAAISPGNNFIVKIYYGGIPPNGGFFNGFSNATSPTWGNAVTWSLSQPNNASQWWPCKQVLTDKLDSCKVWVTVDSSLKVGSNGILENVVLLGSKKRYEWNYAAPIAYYLISVSVARYIEYNFNVTIPGIAKPVFVQNFIYDNPNTLNTFKSEIDKTGDMLKVFSKLFGPYPFAEMKYGHCMAPFSGGMEHNTMTTQGTFNTTLTAHELGHQWWGDHVTCKSWKDIWVNEAFARYCEYIYLKSYSNFEARNRIDEFNRSVLSGLGGSVYVSDTNNVNSIFNGRLTYDKGALVIHMLRFELNDDTLFFKILREYQNQYGNGTAGVNDFQKIFEDLSGKDFTVFFNQWYYGEGYPTIDVYYNYDSKNAVIKTKQRVSMPTITSKFNTSLELKLIGKNKDSTARVFITGDSNVYQIPFSDSLITILVDDDQWILNDTGFVVLDSKLQYYYNGNNDQKNTNVSIYPIPSGDKLYVKGLNRSTSFTLIQMNGKILVHGKIKPNDTIDVSMLKSGSYILKIEDMSFCFIK